MLTAKQTRVDVYKLRIVMCLPNLETSESGSHVNTLEHTGRHHRSYVVDVEDVTRAYLHCKQYYVDHQVVDAILSYKAKGALYSHIQCSTVKFVVEEQDSFLPLIVPLICLSDRCS